MRGGPVCLVLLLAACAHAPSDLSASRPGVDVAQAALRGGSPQTALQLAGGVLARDPGNAAALVVQGDALTQLNRLDEARDSYNLALKSDPASAGADLGLGRIRLADDPAAAVALFAATLRHDPRNTAALNDLGVARDLSGDHAAAQVAYRQALGIDPQDSAAEVNLALSMAMSGSAEDAVRMLRPIATTPGASRKLRHDLAAVLAMAGDRDEAARILGADLSPDEVRQALDDYAAARSGGGGALRADTRGAGEAAVALVPPVAGVAPAGTQVQLAVAATESVAHAEWQRLQQQMPALLADRQPVFTEAASNGHSVWRVCTGGFADAAQALAFCRQVSAAGGECSPGEL